MNVTTARDSRVPSQLGNSGKPPKKVLLYKLGSNKFREFETNASNQANSMDRKWPSGQSVVD